jgi:hypothetical protein
MVTYFPVNRYCITINNRYCKHFLGNLPHNVNDILVINGLVNIINKPTHFDARSSNTSLLDPILITNSIPLRLPRNFVHISQTDNIIILIMSLLKHMLKILPVINMRLSLRSVIYILHCMFVLPTMVS